VRLIRSMSDAAAMAGYGSRQTLSPTFQFAPDTATPTGNA